MARPSLSWNSDDDKRIEVVKETVAPFKKILFVVAAFLCLVIAWFLFTATVPTGHRGIMLQFGQAMNVVGEGLVLKIPFVQNVIIMNVQTQKYEREETAASKDLQDVYTSIAINYRVNPEAAMTLYRNVGVDYERIAIAPAASEVVKSITSKYTAEELITKRETVKNEIQRTFSDRIRKYDIDTEALAITNFKFSDEFTRAIESKVTAEQAALQAKNKLEQVKIEAEQTIAKATAEAESLRLQNEQLRQSKDVLSLRIIEKWDGKLPLVMGANGNIMGLDLVQLQNMSKENEVE